MVIATLALVSWNGRDGHNDGIRRQRRRDGVEQVCEGVLSRLGTLKLIAVDQSLQRTLTLQGTPGSRIGQRAGLALARQGRLATFEATVERVADDVVFTIITEQCPNDVATTTGMRSEEGSKIGRYCDFYTHEASPVDYTPSISYNKSRLLSKW